MRTLSFLRLALTGTVLTVALVASGCGSTTSSSGGGTATDTATSTDTGAGSDATTGSDTASTDVTTAGDTTTGPVSFSTIYPKIQTTCATTGCHTTKDNKFAGKLDLSTQDLAYAGLVTAAKADGICGPTVLVKAGDHANSSLWIRMSPDTTVASAGACGDPAEKMPYNSPATAWAAADVAKVAAWIDAGAAK